MRFLQNVILIEKSKFVIFEGYIYDSINRS